MKILTIVGARPQFIKAAAVSKAIKMHPEIEEIIIHTGQHFDTNMSAVFFEQLEILKPKYNLHIDSLSHGAMTGQMLEKIENVIIKESPDWILVYGDTNSTLAGALSAKKLDFKVAHVEAGLRSFNMRMPEEINRILTDRISDVLFCPTDAAVNNLNNEGFNNFDCDVFKSGDVMFDIAKSLSEKLENKEITIENSLVNQFANKEFVLSTIHRAENTNNLNRLRNIISALNEINKDIAVVMPVHPRTKKILDNLDIKCDFKLIEPVGYIEMIFLLKNCKLVMTDSGGLQKEAYFMKAPCLTLRDETEWVELVEVKCNFVVGTQLENILAAYEKVKTLSFDFSEKIFGDGYASEFIVKELISQQ